jgi:acetyl-CoA carboxylase carboxyl transferase subunit beta
MRTTTRTDVRGVRLLAEDLAPLPTTPAATPEDPLAFPAYRDKLASARQRSRHDESVVVGLATLGGAQVVAAIGAFDFLGVRWEPRRRSPGSRARAGPAEHCRSAAPTAS